MVVGMSSQLFESLLQASSVTSTHFTAEVCFVITGNTEKCHERDKVMQGFIFDAGLRCDR